jgi:hypothetical protein
MRVTHLRITRKQNIRLLCVEKCHESQFYNAERQSSFLLCSVKLQLSPEPTPIKRITINYQFTQALPRTAYENTRRHLCQEDKYEHYTPCNEPSASTHGLRSISWEVPEVAMLLIFTGNRRANIGRQLVIRYRKCYRCRYLLI